MSEFQNVSERIIGHLSAHIGRNVAKMAVTDFSRKSLGVKPDSVRPADVPALLDAMRPMLTVLLGKDHTETIVRRIATDAVALQLP